MEVLNKFWTLMTTENEIITKLFTIPTIPIEVLLSFFIIKTFFEIDSNNKQLLIYSIILSVLSIVTKFLISEPFNTFINYIGIFIVIKFVLKTNILKSALYTIIPSISFAISGTLILKPFLIIYKLTYSQLELIPLHRLNYLCTLYIFLAIIILLFKNKNLVISFKEDFNKENKKVIIQNILLGFFTLCVQLTITVFYTDILPSFIIFLSLLSLISYFFISIFSLTKTMKLQITTRNLESAENYNATLSYLYDNVKAFKHDFDNMVFIIGGFIDKNDISGLKKYYKNLEKDCERVNNIALLNPELINNSGIYNLLTAKYKKAEENKVEIHLEFFFDFNKLKIPIYDFSRILGILLDNAIEAAKDTNEKQVFIIIRDSSRNNTQIVNIKNSYINKNIDTTKIFEKGITEKENHSGIGLWEVNQILKRNNNIKLITRKDDIYFEQNLEIYY